ncbi:MAG: porin [Pseudomonadota bacterium]|nr:porin [Pseudomonadota bacterium]
MAYKVLFNKLLILVIFTHLFFGANKVSAESKNYKKNSSDILFYGRLFVQYDSIKAGDSGSTASVDGLRDDEGMGRFGIKGKESIGDGYAVNYKVEYAIDIGDGTATSDGTTCSDASADCRTFAMKQGWIGLLTPFGQFKIGSVKAPYRYMAKHDILHDTITQARDTRMITQSSMGHSSYWRESASYQIKFGNLELAYVRGFGEGTGGGGKDVNDDYGYGIEYKNFLTKGFDVVYAANKDDSAKDDNKKMALTYNIELANKRKIKLWYMHEEVGLDSKMFTQTGNDGEVDWYGINYKTGPLTIQYSYSEADADAGSGYDRDGYNLGFQYKLSKSSRIYTGYSKNNANQTGQDIRATMIGVRHDF